MLEKISILQKLKVELELLILDEDFLYRVESNNPFFTLDFVKISIQSIIDEYLDESKLKTWLSNYSIQNHSGHLGLILAGNIPIVGFHDILCAYFCSESISLKLSSKDSVLTKRVLELWFELDPDFNSRCQIVDRLGNIDKIIATGSNNAHQYFEFYFKKFKHILRKNRTSIAILSNDTSDEDIDLLMDDIFLYFGLGCRNVTKLFIEKGFELRRIFEASERYNFLFQHSKYMNNYDYHRTILLLNNIQHLSNNFLMLKEDSNLFSPISVVHYEYFENTEELNSKLELIREDIQCIVGEGKIPFGDSQKPSLSEYADGVDTIEFLIS